MKVQINGTFKGLKDEDVMATDNVKLTFKDVAVNALLSPDQTDIPDIKEKKYTIYKLIKLGVTEISITNDQMVLLRRCIGKTASTLIMGQCYEQIDGK